MINYAITCSTWRIKSVRVNLGGLVHHQEQTSKCLQLLLSHRPTSRLPPPPPASPLSSPPPLKPYIAHGLGTRGGFSVNACASASDGARVRANAAARLANMSGRSVAGPLSSRPMAPPRTKEMLKLIHDLCDPQSQLHLTYISTCGSYLHFVLSLHVSTCRSAVHLVHQLAG